MRELDTGEGKVRQAILFEKLHEKGGATPIPPQEAGGHPEGAGAWASCGEGIQGEEQEGWEMYKMRLGGRATGSSIM